MDIYRFALYLGFTGLAAMAVLGAGHIGGQMMHGHGGHAGIDGFNAHGTGAPTLGHTSHDIALPGHGHGGAHHGHGHSGHGHDVGFRWTSVLALLSPRVLFSIMLGFGATGFLAKGFALEPWRLIFAVVGGFAFEFALMGPVWNAWMRFGSNPARTLETAVAEEARAVTDFDANGDGLISLELDGHSLQVLARLTPAQREAGTRVRTGNRLFIEAVDAARNSCTVSLMN